MRSKVGRCVLAVGWTALGVACGSSFSSRSGGDGGLTADGGGSPDGPTAGDAQGGSSSGSSGAEGGASSSSGGGAATYGDITNPGKWQAMTIPADLDGGYSSPGYIGAAFDGKNLYFAPNEQISGNFSGVVSRYQTTASFLNSASWSSFGMDTVNANAIGFAGAEFDGRYVYYVPYAYNHNPGYSGLVLRFDSQAPFGSGTSYDLFDTTSVSANARGFMGGAFDGRYVYLSPYLGTASMATRYDTTASFASGASWQTFDTTGIAATAVGYAGAAFDGRYVYYAPFGSDGNSGLVIRYDTTASFTSATGWGSFDLTTLNTLAEGYFGAVFDGRYVYFVPVQHVIGGVGVPSGRVARFDTQYSFTDASSWATFDLTLVNPNATGFVGGVFDGRYVYLVPQGRQSQVAGMPTITARLDTTGTFTSATAWTTMDLSQVTDRAYSYTGGAFDGEYVYYVPSSGQGVALRFDAKTPPSMPSSYKGSFF